MGSSLLLLKESGVEGERGRKGGKKGGWKGGRAGEGGRQVGR